MTSGRFFSAGGNIVILFLVFIHSFINLVSQEAETNFQVPHYKLEIQKNSNLPESFCLRENLLFV